jgi:hypothetical protein
MLWGVAIGLVLERLLLHEPSPSPA